MLVLAFVAALESPSFLRQPSRLIGSVQNTSHVQSHSPFHRLATVKGSQIPLHPDTFSEEEEQLCCGSIVL